MKFVCLDCKKTFVYPAKKIDNWIPSIFPTIPQTTDATVVSQPQKTVETHVCPYCHSLNIDDQVEPQPDITSVISVPIEEVDAKLKEGYAVRELYAKTATLVKLEKKAISV
jgi:hypothetical protein